MEQGSNFNQGQVQRKTGLGQGLPQEDGHLLHPEAVLPDIGEHAVGCHQSKALVARR